MKLLLIVFFTIFPFLVFAQDNPLPGFICMYTGKAILPYGFSKSSNEPKIKSCNILKTYVHKEQDLISVDTSLVYKLYYAPNGDGISVEGIYSEFKGFTDLKYNKDGTLAFKEFETEGIRGCSNYHWMVGGKIRYDYEYNHGNCTKISNNKYHFTQNRYNKKRQLLTTEDYYRASDTTDFEKMGLGFGYRYNQDNQLADEFTLEAFYNRTPDSINYLPDDIGERLYRQSWLYYDSILVRDYGVTKDSMQMVEDIPPALLAAINLRDSMDREWMAVYERVARGLSTYEYNRNGQLSRRITYKGDDIDMIETFGYNEMGQLITWDKMQDYNDDWTRWSDGTQEIWTFEYSEKNQITACEQQRFTGRERDFEQREKAIKAPLKIDEDRKYTFHYNEQDLMVSATRSEEHWYYFSKESPVVYEPATYYIQYEMF